MDEYHQIKDYPKYEINKNGSVRRVYKNGNIIYLKPHPNIKSKYLTVSLHNQTKTLHRLLAVQFIPNPDNKPMVDHINVNRQDNRLENLRWSTCEENRHNTLRKNKGCIFTRKDKFKKLDGTTKIYISYRFAWYPEHNKKKSKTFKTKLEAEEFRNTIYDAQTGDLLPQSLTAQ